MRRHIRRLRPRTRRAKVLYAIGAIALLGLVLVALVARVQGSALRQMTNGRLEGADYWDEEPKILSAGFGFDNIIGLPNLEEDTVRAGGGSWYDDLRCTNGDTPDETLYTSSATSEIVERGYEGYAEYDDGLPVVFSWPVATETMDPTDFEFTLNTGEVVFGHAAGMNPNWEDNERNTVVLFGEFGNRESGDDPDAVYVTRLEIVDDGSPLTLVGPGGQEVNAVGLTWTTETSPYDVGPKLVGAKLNRVEARRQGEGGVTIMDRLPYMPNDELSLYDEGDFRIRLLTSGGFSPDGVTGLRPDMFEDFFRIHAMGTDGQTTLLEKAGTTYTVAGGDLRVVGLSDLGRRADEDGDVVYDDCYEEDADNYIDIILVGDDAAARSISHVEIPALEGGYRAFYNPGGPGPQPTPGVTYTAPGPPDLEPVVIALDDPMRVSRG